METRNHAPAWTKAAQLVAAAGAGAGLMYLLDPNRGNARRAQLRDRSLAWAREGGNAIEKKLRHIEHRAEGLVSEARGYLAPEQPVDDRKLEARVHTRLGRATANPHAVRVFSLGGHVVIGGAAPAGEIEKIVRAVGQTPGVKSVENRLADAGPAEKAPKTGNGILVPTLLAVGSGVLAAVRNRLH
ncbi:MAG: BON domain-containing protein [Bryobacteraceae bacterium]